MALLTPVQSSTLPIEKTLKFFLPVNAGNDISFPVMKKRHTYWIQPAGSEKWIECKRNALPQLRKYHGKERVKVDTRETALGSVARIYVDHFISIEP